MIILNLDNKSKIPLYIQIYTEIKNLIQTKILKANEKLPSKKDFIDYYNISQNTVQNALYLLLEEGYIFSIERKGYFVSEPSLRELLKMFMMKRMKIYYFKGIYKGIYY